MAHSASFSNTTHNTALPSIVRQAMNLVRERLEAQRERARMRAELNSYTSRELADLGMGRGDIEDVIFHRFAR